MGLARHEKDSCRENLMQRLERFALKDNLVSRLLRSFFVFDHASAPPDTTQVSDKKYKAYESRIIRHVEIVVLDPFGYSVSDTSRKKIKKRPQRWANTFHYRTRNWIIENKLLFEEGDSLDAYKISESERLLRQSPYLLDARIITKAVPSSQDSVDIMVIAQDVFSIGAAASGDPLHQNGTVTLEDRNFIGLGQRLYNQIWYDPTYKDNWRYSGQYFIQEIAKTYITGELHYFTTDNDRRTGFSFNRPFYSPTAHWAGGIAMDFHKQDYSLPLTDSTQLQGTHNFRNDDIWAGYSFKPRIGECYEEKKSQIIVSGRIMRTTYEHPGPYESELLNHTYQNEITYLASVGYSFREYYKDRYIFGFGRTEDIPLGYLFTLTGGWDKAQTYERPYGGAKVSYGWNNSSLGYMYTGIETGGYLHDHKVEQGVISAQFLYFTSMLPVRSWTIRQFLWTRFTLGYNRLPGEQLDINSPNGLRVFSSPLRGTQRLVSNYEMDIFTPWKPLGFKIVGVLFADFGLIGDHAHPVLQSAVYQGYGLGVRIKNEKLIFNTFELSLHFYPNAKLADAKDFTISHTEQIFYRFQDFQFSEPYIAPF
jgi:hypothetical protein